MSTTSFSFLYFVILIVILSFIVIGMIITNHNTKLYKKLDTKILNIETKLININNEIDLSSSQIFNNLKDQVAENQEDINNNNNKILSLISSFSEKHETLLSLKDLVKINTHNIEGVQKNYEALDNDIKLLNEEHKINKMEFTKVRHSEEFIPKYISSILINNINTLHVMNEYIFKEEYFLQDITKILDSTHYIEKSDIMFIGNLCFERLEVSLGEIKSYNFQGKVFHIIFKKSYDNCVLTDLIIFNLHKNFIFDSENSLSLSFIQYESIITSFEFKLKNTDLKYQFAFISRNENLNIFDDFTISSIRNGLRSLDFNKRSLCFSLSNNHINNHLFKELNYTSILYSKAPLSFGGDIHFSNFKEDISTIIKQNQEFKTSDNKSIGILHFEI